MNLGSFDTAEDAAVARARAMAAAEAAAAESQDDASDDSEEEVTEPCHKNPTRCTRKSGLHFEHRVWCVCVICVCVTPRHYPQARPQRQVQYGAAVAAAATEALVQPGPQRSGGHLGEC